MLGTAVRLGRRLAAGCDASRANVSFRLATSRNGARIATVRRELEGRLDAALGGMLARN
jgi:hypothetical protein